MVAQVVLEGNAADFWTGSEVEPIVRCGTTGRWVWLVKPVMAGVASESRQELAKLLMLT